MGHAMEGTARLVVGHDRIIGGGGFFFKVTQLFQGYGVLSAWVWAKPKTHLLLLPLGATQRRALPSYHDFLSVVSAFVTLLCVNGLVR